MEEQKNRHKFVIGDSSAKLGKKLDEEETKIGNFGYSQRNKIAVILINYLQKNVYKQMNSQNQIVISKAS